MSEHVTVERRGAVQAIRMNRPDKKNALTRDMYTAMTEALRAGDADAAIRCHVFFGVPGVFSAGNDLGDFLEMASGGEDGNEVFDFLLALAASEKPVLSGADGVAVGIGTTLHLHCDLTFATPETVFHTPFIDLGLVPEAASSLLAPALMGRQRAFAMLVLGEPLEAEHALAAGLIHAVVEAFDLEDAVLAAAERLAAKPPEALRIARDLIRGPREAVAARIEEEAGHFRERLKSDEARAAFEAFMNRKKE